MHKHRSINMEVPEARDVKLVGVFFSAAKC